MSTTVATDTGSFLSEKVKDIGLIVLFGLVVVLVLLAIVYLYWTLCRQKNRSNRRDRFFSETREEHNSSDFGWINISYLNDQLQIISDQVQYLLSKSPLCLDSYKVLNKVEKPENWQLEKSYCIVTFNDDNVNEIIPIIQDCFVGKVRFKDLDMNQLKIIKREDVLELPKSKVHLVCITKNDKNVILEPPNSDLGDLRLLTVKACRKINGEVFVIYYGDEDSRTLMPKLLYNPQIACVTEHPELKELERQDKVITCADKLTITQRERLAEFIV